MELTDYQKKIVQYYNSTENAYKDAWDLENSLAIHYGYRDKKAKSFSASLIRMNEVMMEEAAIEPGCKVLDAGCGIGGSSLFLAESLGCFVKGISLSERQIQKARALAAAKGMKGKVEFEINDYCQTGYRDEEFDIVWACESMCYAESKSQFIREAYRILKPGGRLVIADGFVSSGHNNEHPYIRRWLDGWQVNYLESPSGLLEILSKAGFSGLRYRDITPFTRHSARRLNRYFYLANLYLFWKSITRSNRATPMQKMNISACRYQWLGMKKGLWQYGLAVARKP